MTKNFLAILSFSASLQAVTLPEGTVEHRNIAYGTHELQKMDIYVPPATKPNGEPFAPAGPKPVVVWIHGGGWGFNTDDAFDKAALPSEWPLWDKYVYVSINYRLAPENRWPAQIIDCRSAIRFLRANAAQYQIDPDKIAVWGGSSGGHLAAMLGMSANRTQWDQGNHLNTSSQVQAVCDFYGPSQLMTWWNRTVESKRPFCPPLPLPPGDGPAIMQAFMPNGTFSPSIWPLTAGPFTVEDSRLQDASPLAYKSPEDAPVIIFHGDRDALVPVWQSEDLHRDLRAQNTPASLKVIAGAGHSLDDAYTKEDMIAFLGAHFRNNQTRDVFCVESFDNAAGNAGRWFGLGEVPTESHGAGQALKIANTSPANVLGTLSLPINTFKGRTVRLSAQIKAAAVGYNVIKEDFESYPNATAASIKLDANASSPAGWAYVAYNIHQPGTASTAGIDQSGGPGGDGDAVGTTTATFITNSTNHSSGFRAAPRQYNVAAVSIPSLASFRYSFQVWQTGAINPNFFLRFSSVDAANNITGTIQKQFTPGALLQPSTWTTFSGHLGEAGWSTIVGTFNLNAPKYTFEWRINNGWGLDSDNIGKIDNVMLNAVPTVAPNRGINVSLVYEDPIGSHTLAIPVSMGSYDWTTLTSANLYVPENATSAMLQVGLQGVAGTVSFDEITLEASTGSKLFSDNMDNVEYISYLRGRWLPIDGVISSAYPTNGYANAYPSVHHSGAGEAMRLSNENAAASNILRCRVPHEIIRSRNVFFKAQVRAENVSAPAAAADGIQVVLRYRRSDHTEVAEKIAFPQAALNFNWTNFAKAITIPANVTNAWIDLGLQRVTGAAEFDNISIEKAP